MPARSSSISWRDACSGGTRESSEGGSPPMQCKSQSRRRLKNKAYLSASVGLARVLGECLFASVTARCRGFIVEDTVENTLMVSVGPHVAGRQICGHLPGKIVTGLLSHLDNECGPVRHNSRPLPAAGQRSESRRDLAFIVCCSLPIGEITGRWWSPRLGRAHRQRPAPLIPNLFPAPRLALDTPAFHV